MLERRPRQIEFISNCLQPLPSIVGFITGKALIEPPNAAAMLNRCIRISYSGNHASEFFPTIGMTISQGSQSILDCAYRLRESSLFIDPLAIL